MQFAPRLMPLHKLTQGCGFQMAKRTTLAEYKKQADVVKAQLCERHGISQDDNEALETLFWRIVQTELEQLTVSYGADLDVDTHSSGFTSVEGGAWNLRRLASHPDSLLCHLTSGVPGVSSPWLYVGMVFGAFCWHVEDLWMYSCNYLHRGAPKTWYVVPGASAEQFERAARGLLPAVFDASPDLLLQLVAMFPPSDLCARGVPVYKIMQSPGEFVVTFPRGYHAGFSHGFNIAEAVNFASADWLPYGRNAMYCARKHRRTPCFSVERLLSALATSKAKQSLPGLLPWLVPEIQAVVNEEVALREGARASGVKLQLLAHTTVIMGQPSLDPQDESLSCSQCGHILYLSGAVAPSAQDRCVCLRPACLASLECEPQYMVAWMRFRDAGLRRLAACGGAAADAGAV